MAAGRIDVHRDFLLRIFRFKEEQLGRDQRGHHILDDPGYEDYALFQQPGVDIEGALAAVRLFDNHRHELIGVVVYWIAHTFLPGINKPRHHEFTRLPASVAGAWNRFTKSGAGCLAAPAP